MATGNIHHFAGITVGSEQINLPTRPWHGSGNIHQYDGSSDINFTDTPSESAKILKWVEINDGDKTLYISDRVLLVNISWEMLNNMGYVFGKEVTIDGSKYKCRLLTGGAGPRDTSNRYAGGTPTNNEWDRYIVNEANLSGLPTPSSTDLDGDLVNADLDSAHNKIWWWSHVFTLCQETLSNFNKAITIRGYESVAFIINRSKNIQQIHTGWRPVLEVIRYRPRFELSPYYNTLFRPNDTISLNIYLQDLDLNDTVTIYASMDGYFEKEVVKTYTGTEDSTIGFDGIMNNLNFVDGILHIDDKPITGKLEYGKKYTINLWAEDKFGLVSDTAQCIFDLELSYPSINISDYNDICNIQIITELREATNEFRKFNGLKEINWTVPDLIPGVTPIRAVDWNEIKMAILEVYTKLGINFTDSTLERKLNDIILANNKRYQVNDLPLRINEIIKALKNE